MTTNPNNIKWAFTGEEALQMTQVHDANFAANKELRKNKLDEFYLAKGESATLLFLDDLPFFYYRHVIPNASGGFDNFTCLTEKGNCPLCKAGKAKTWVGCATVIDLSRSFASKKHAGRVYKFKKLILAAKGDQRNRLLFLKQNSAGGSLKFARINFHRGATSNVSLGESIDFKDKVDMNWIKAFVAKHLNAALPAYADQKNVVPKPLDWLTPVDYYSAFPFLDAPTLARLTGVALPGNVAGPSVVGGGLDDLDSLGIGGSVGGGFGGNDADMGLDSGFNGSAGMDDDLLGMGATATNTAPVVDDLDDLLR